MKLRITMHTEKTVHKNIFSKNESKNLGVRMRRGECKTENKRAVGETLKAGKGRQRIRWGNVRSECNREKLWCSHVKHVTLIKKGRGWRLRVREWVVVGSNCKRLRKVPAFTLWNWKTTKMKTLYSTVLHKNSLSLVFSCRLDFWQNRYRK